MAIKHFFELQSMPFGKKRRELILQLLKSPVYISFGGLSVNRKYCSQLSEDNDLRYMLKKGILKRVRGDAGGKARITKLILAKTDKE